MAIAEGGPEVDMPALPELAQFVVPLIQGSVHQIHGLQLVTATADYSGSLTLVARRSSQRPGVRHWRRGAAMDVSASSGNADLVSAMLALHPAHEGHRRKLTRAVTRCSLLDGADEQCC